MLYRLIKIVLLAIITSSFSQIASAAKDDLDELQMKLSNQWTLVKNDRLRDIKTYARLENGKQYRSFKATVMMKDTKPETLVRFLLDFENYHKWYWQVLESKLLSQS